MVGSSLLRLALGVSLLLLLLLLRCGLGLLVFSLPLGFGKMPFRLVRVGGHAVIWGTVLEVQPLLLLFFFLLQLRLLEHLADALLLQLWVRQFLSLRAAAGFTCSLFGNLRLGKLVEWCSR